MRIAIHLNQFDGRGTGRAVYDYGTELRDQFGHEVLFVASRRSFNPTLDKLRRKFNAILYDGSLGSHQENRNVGNLLSRIVDDEKIDFMYLLKYGIDDRVTPNNCRTGVHCVFDMSEPHGNVYAGVSNYVARKFRRDVFVPHIVRRFARSVDCRVKFGIPAGATVIGRHGGYETFDIPFVRDAIRTVLSRRGDIYFLFLATNRFYEHDRIIHVPWTQSRQEIFDFIYACDAMLHARRAGETFGLAVAEFSIANKPVITWTGQCCRDYDTCHLDLLGDRAVLYDAYDDLLTLLLEFDGRAVEGADWDRYSREFNAPEVMHKFRSVFFE